MYEKFSISLTFLKQLHNLHDFFVESDVFPWLYHETEIDKNNDKKQK